MHRIAQRRIVLPFLLPALALLAVFFLYPLARTVGISLTVWGGTFVCITGDFGRERSRFLMVTRPLENGHTLCEGIVLARRPANALMLWVRPG